MTRAPTKAKTMKTSAVMAITLRVRDHDASDDPSVNKNDMISHDQMMLAKGGGAPSEDGVTSSAPVRSSHGTLSGIRKKRP